MSNTGCRSVDASREDGEHLDGLPDGSGCFEIWEHLSDARRRPADD